MLYSLNALVFKEVNDFLETRVVRFPINAIIERVINDVSLNLDEILLKEADVIEPISNEITIINNSVLGLKKSDFITAEIYIFLDEYNNGVVVDITDDNNLTKLLLLDKITNVDLIDSVKDIITVYTDL